MIVIQFNVKKVCQMGQRKWLLSKKKRKKGKERELGNVYISTSHT